MFRRVRKRVYLDHAASTPPTKKALQAFTRASLAYGNPSSLHSEGVEAKRILEDARERVARALSVRSSGVTFTSGATEANNLAIVGTVLGVKKNGRELTDTHVLYHEGAHASIVETVTSLDTLGVETGALALSKGAPDLNRLSRQLRPTTTLVILEAVSGETGMVFKTRDVRRVLDAYTREHGGKITMLVDASQAPRTQPVSIHTLGADMLVLDAQKIGGVRGCGVLARAHGTALESIMHGGPQERGLRPGTENPALALSMAVALEEAQAQKENFEKHASELRSLCIKELSATYGAVVHTAPLQSSHIVNVSFPGRDTDYALFLLDARGFSVSTKSACESGETGSRMVEISTGDRELATSTLRISLAPSTTRSETKRFLKELEKIIRFLDKTAIE